MKSPLADKIQTDFHKLLPGDWFLPMTIKDVDQHSLIPQALNKDLSGFSYDKNLYTPASDLHIPHLGVDSLREYLFNLAVEKRPSLQTDIAVITGSAGKTSVKELVGAILKASAQETYISPDNQNTKIALATQILRLPLSCRYAAFEMGARRVNDFAVPLSYLQPTIVALLNIGTAHIGEFGSSANLLQEKLSGLSSNSAKTLVANADDSRILDRARATGKKVISFGYSPSADIQILDESADGLSFKINGQNIFLNCAFQSSAKAMNVAAAVGIALALNLSMEVIQKALAGFAGVPRRFQSLQWQGVQCIDDAFNSSPESMYAGLQRFSEISKGKKSLLVLGSMLELGDESENVHRKVAHQIAELFHDQQVSLITVGEEARLIADEAGRLNLNLNALSFADSLEAKAALQDLSGQFETIYFKGSKSVKLNLIFEGASS